VKARRVDIIAMPSVTAWAPRQHDFAMRLVSHSAVPTYAAAVTLNRGASTVVRNVAANAVISSRVSAA
jgi:hypothetical protein